ncbi:chitinase [Hyalangium rubrum]|uniref:Glycosyl hydrolase family 18 protein n=1 Tax=Hyalangium rubrum TaxID=3103134 RepID=A0ABU5HAE4_9BACT|nr:glycosyl hydrolase family 18 protein [Hyalangium sp. s54d21]MDY7229090.1 glycosyl hydrolase family 18 protein [Hyalangium sp. s54d21]
MSLRRWKALALAGLFFFLAAPQVHAQTVSCTGIPAWNAQTIYNPGDKVVYQSKLYEALVAIWTADPVWGTASGWYRLLGTCGTGGGGAPTVSLTSPGNGATFQAPADISLSANASDTGGSITKVDFFANGSFVGTDSSSPYQIAWTGVAAGAYALTAVATDNSGLSTTSSAINITVNGGTGGGGNLPKRLLVGYWHNFVNGAGFMKLRDVSNDWDVINVSFAEPVAGSTSRMAFVPDSNTSAQELKSDIQLLKNRGKKVLISIGGANGHVQMRTETERQEFVSTMKQIISEYGFHGMDIDFEGSSISLNSGDADFKNPTTPLVKHLISAIREIRNHFGPTFILSMAPEVYYVQVGYQVYGPTAGAYLPVIYGVRDILTYIHPQHYNTGSVLGLDNVAYNAGTADFHVAMAEMLLRGFPVGGNANNVFPALRPDQVAIGLPATPQAAGSGFTSAADVQKAVGYLTKGTSFGGRYQLRNPAGYSDFRGVMTWSVNWDKYGGFSFSLPHRQYLNTLP